MKMASHALGPANLVHGIAIAVRPTVIVQELVMPVVEVVWVLEDLVIGIANVAQVIAIAQELVMLEAEAVSDKVDRALGVLNAARISVTLQMYVTREIALQIPESVYIKSTFLPPY